ncbi:hypothetical protein BD410DRAFT_830028 [Rickenella mellea]|uniref:C2H2-type domain-containing protein n=1 Tax=Rickenella mellea TaxID=50990 RepID=A0A4Y7PX12_9AGAM|nr:hypothetical protein BD410DRAFT_830028 [Rickenella mellea]
MDQQPVLLQHATELFLHLSLGTDLSTSGEMHETADLQIDDTFHKVVFESPRRRVRCDDIFPRLEEISRATSPELDSVTLATRARTMSEAEEVAASYRAQQFEKEKDVAPVSPHSPDDKPLPAPPLSRWSLTTSIATNHLPFDDSESSSLSSYMEYDKVSGLSREGPRTRISNSITRALAEAAIEAKFLVDDSIRNRQLLRCNRLECQQILPSEKALKFHIHMHKLAEAMVICHDCQHEFETNRELTMHKCSAVNSKSSSTSSVPSKFSYSSPPTSPTSTTFRRALVKMCCTQDTSLEN